MRKVFIEVKDSVVEDLKKHNCVCTDANCPCLGTRANCQADQCCLLSRVKKDAVNVANNKTNIVTH